MTGNFDNERHFMVEYQIAARGIHDPRLLAAFEKVPRHRFVDSKSSLDAYDDRPLLIGFGQTISQPYIVALMLSLLELKGGERVLEVGTGSGYQAALLAELAGEVHTIEYVPDLARSAGVLLKELDYRNIWVNTGDGSVGWPTAAPYAGIIVSAAAPKVPPPLVHQLADGGCLVLPVGDDRQQQLEVVTKHAGELTHEVGVGVAFVPLLGEYGWKGR